MANPNQPNPPNVQQYITPAPGGPAASINSAGPGTTLWALDSTGLCYYTATNSLVAHAGGGQALGTPILTNIVRFTTVATIADSGTLPATSVAGTAINANITSGLGLEITVANAGANSMNVFPATGEQINALGANAAFALAAGKTAIFTCTSSGQWHAVLSA